MANIVLGVDIGGTQIKAGLVESSGMVLRSDRINTPLELTALRAALKTLFTRLNARDIAGAGVGCKGIIDPATTRVDCLPGIMCYIEGCVLSDIVREALGSDVPVCADNDARVALVGEWVWGAARGKRDAVLLTLGTGVGGAVLVDGRILRGHRGVAGHLGHITVDPDGPLCICGNRGCLESVFSARVVEAEAYAAQHRGVVTAIPAAASCADVFAAARNGDTLAQTIVERGIRQLGAGIAGLLHALDPEVVILGGQMARAGEMLFAPVAAEVAWRTRGLLRREVPIVPMQVEDPSGIVGAAALVFTWQTNQ